MPTIDEAFTKLRSNLELSKSLQDAVSTRHNAVRSYIENRLPGAQTKLIGSFQRKTKIHPVEGSDLDIDILLILGRFSSWGPNGVAPDVALAAAEDVLTKSRRYQQMNPLVDSPTVSMDYADGVSVEIVPAYEDHVGISPSDVPCPPVGRGYWVATAQGWLHADYDYDAEMVTLANQAAGNLVVPIIKMLKALKRRHFPEMKSFHLEILAANWLPSIIQEYRRLDIPATYPLLLESFFTWTSDLLMRPACLPGSNSPGVCVNLLEGMTLRQKYSTLKEQIRAVNRYQKESDQLAGWRVLFGDAFPAY